MLMVWGECWWLTGMLMGVGGIVYGGRGNVDGGGFGSAGCER